MLFEPNFLTGTLFLSEREIQHGPSLFSLLVLIVWVLLFDIMSLTSRRVGKTSPEAGAADALQEPDSRLPQLPQSPGDPKLSEAAQLQEKFRAGPYLVLSSLFFLQPILFANCVGVHHGPVGFVSKFMTVVCFVSCMYWYHPTDGWRLTLDLTMAKASFVVVLVTALLYGEGGMHGCRVLGIIFGAMIVIEYQLSCYFFYRGSRIWPLFHASMHFTGGLNQAICLYIMIRSQISSTQLDTCHLSALDALLQDFNRYLAGPGVVDSFMKWCTIPLDQYRI